MSRTVSVKIGGKSRKLKATWDAGEQICENVCDLYMISAELGKTALYAKLARPYKAEFSFTMRNVLEIMEIALDASGHDVDQDVLKDWVLEVGLTKAVLVAQEYLSLFYGEPEEKPEADEPAETEEKGKGK